MSAADKRFLIITNLYPVPWGENRASFNKQQFEFIEQLYPVNIILLLTWTEWLVHRTECVSDSKIKYCPYFYIPKIGRRLVPFFQLLSLLFFIPWIKKQQATALISAWGFPDAVASSMLNSFLKLPFFVKVHGTDINENIQFDARKKQMFHWLNKAKAIFCPSQALVNSLESIGITNNKATVNYNGVNKEIFYPSTQNSAKSQHLVFVGSLIASKGVNELLLAFVEAKKQCPKLQLDILGEGPLKGSLMKKVNEYDLHDSIRLHGSVSLEKVAEYIRGAYALVLPSYREGVPNVLLESFASGTPIIATSVGGIPEVVNNSVGLLVDSKNVSQLTQAIIKAIDTTWSKENILEHAKQFDWHKNVQYFLEKMDE